jgi:hypothetical protein
VIPEVTLTDLGIAKVNTTTSDGNGLYSFNALPPGQYSLVVSKGGFKQKTRVHSGYARGATSTSRVITLSNCCTNSANSA